MYHTIVDTEMNTNNMHIIIITNKQTNPKNRITLIYFCFSVSFFSIGKICIGLWVRGVDIMHCFQLFVRTSTEFVCIWLWESRFSRLCLWRCVDLSIGWCCGKQWMLCTWMSVSEHAVTITHTDWCEVGFSKRLEKQMNVKWKEKWCSEMIAMPMLDFTKKIFLTNFVRYNTDHTSKSNNASVQMDSNKANDA